MTECSRHWYRKLRGAMALGLAFVVVGLLSCEGPQSINVGGQTHFLQACDAAMGEQACGGELSCISNICTLSCANVSACPAYPNAECVEALDGTGRVCDVSCSRDGDCAALSANHLCVENTCRKSDQSILPTPTLSCMPGEFDSSDVLLVGDSFFAASHEISASLTLSAQGAGVLGEESEFRDRSSLLDNALAFMGGGLVDQFREGVANGEVRLVIMNGGGADVVLGTCDTINEQCPLLTDAAEAAESLFVEMADSGVEQVIYVFYPDPQDMVEKERMDALRPLIESVCLQAPLSCHFLDLQPVFDGKYEEYLLADGLNPTEAGSAATADEVWTLLKVCLEP